MDEYNNRHTKGGKIMCLYPKLIKNPKYKPNKKNGGQVPPVSDSRTLYIPVGCQKCMECKKQKARQWQVRLSEEIKTDTSGKFVVLTFSDESIQKLKEISSGIEGYELDNEIAKIGMRRFLERWRKKHKKSVKHWCVTELGQERTENIHIHGIIFTDEIEDIKSLWQYGIVFIGGYVNESSVAYMTKYVNKIDPIHQEYNPKILTSAGIGSDWINGQEAIRNRYKEGGTNESYTYRTGLKGNLPTYYRNKIYTEEEREKLWIKKIEEKVRYVNGFKIDISNGEEQYWRSIEHARKKNARLGYGNNEDNWERKQYERDRRNMLTKQRIDRAEKRKEDKFHEEDVVK